jgi:molybdopterin molybdotransferase
MTSNDRKSCGLENARQHIFSHIPEKSAEVVAVQEGLHRIVFSDVVAIAPQPTFDESIRDGYVLSRAGGSVEKTGRYEIIDEIPAGKPSLHTLAAGIACRIMTGGAIPKGGGRVVPYEDCLEQDGAVTIADRSLRAAETFIKKTGSEIARGELLVPGGTPLQAGHLALLASCGIHTVAVAGRPGVGYVCTGNELTVREEGLAVGQKFSSNALLLQGLLASVGARPVNLGIVKDTDNELLDIFTKISTSQLDAMITTGGMGPGKYDLVERVFIRAGGKVIFNSIAMRPGKAVLFGVLGRTLFFGLPGPPHAVRTLLNELVGPALLAMQGINGRWPNKVQAHLHHQIKIKRNDILRLKDAVLVLEEGRCLVRFAGRLEIPNCFMLLPPGQTDYDEGARVEVHLTNELVTGR